MNDEKIINNINNGKNLFNKFDNLLVKRKNIEVLTKEINENSKSAEGKRK